MNTITNDPFHLSSASYATKHFYKNASKAHPERKECLFVGMASILNSRPKHRSLRQKSNEVACLVPLLSVVFNLLFGGFGPIGNKKSLWRDQFGLV